MDHTNRKRPNIFSRGETLIELLVAIGIFVTIVSVLVFLMLDSFVAGRLAQEMTEANFLAEEGIEAVRSIRDNNWDDLASGEHGLVISGSTWIFQGTQESVNQLREGVRKIVVENISSDVKKITSQVAWQFTEARPQEARIVTYLTNWQKTLVYHCGGTCIPCSGFLDRKLCNGQDGCNWVARDKACIGVCTPCESFSDQVSCEGQSGCAWAEL